MIHYWTDEEIKYLKRVYATHSRNETVKMFQKHFNSDISREKIISIIKRRGFRTCSDGRYKKGCTPANKGEKMTPEKYAKCAKTMYKKGNVPTCNRPVGSERITADGYIEVKISEPKGWERLHILVMQSILGRPIDRFNEVIRFIDGNTQNCDPDNLILTTRKAHLRSIVREQGATPEINKAIIQVETIKDKIRSMEK